ncbi:MAG: sigma-70 family RNA polymerase sigma factor [Herbiconiux sp.]|nr:sigma-70 family RNA polymerase sigma factor [Herbiconiux sp.]
MNETETETRDAVLLEAAGAGDGRALSTLYDRYAPAVTRYAWALAADRHDVEEILQDTFVTLWRSARRIRLVDSSALPWLLVTCRNHALNLQRKRSRHRSVPLPDELGAAADHSDAADQLRWVLAEIGRLDPIDQRVCELCLIEGRPYKEVAALLETSVGAVKQRVARSRARLRKVVTDDEN